MDKDVNLINRGFTNDALGNQIATETKTEIPVEVLSITRDEFYRAGEQKINPEMVLKTAADNYAGQELVEVDSVRYTVYRKYRDTDSDDIELYLRKEVGNA